MESKFIGVIRGVETGMILAVINPDDDAELDNPRFLLMRPSKLEPMELIKVSRADYMGAKTMDNLIAIIERFR